MSTTPNIPITARSVTSRRTWPDYFMTLADQVSMQSTCLRRKVGALAVRDKRILATGYNGAPRGLQHCTETGCLRDQMHIPSGERHELCRATHAEQNVICQAASSGVSLEGADIYCTTHPCLICTKMLINCAIARVIYRDGYPDNLSAQFLAAANIEAVQIHDLIIRERYYTGIRTQIHAPQN